jgi:hypothetical protein
MIAPLVGDLECQRLIAGRVQTVNTGANDGHRAARRPQRSPVRSGVYSEGKTTDDRQPGLGEGRGKALGVLDALGRRVAAAHDREGSRVQQIEAAADIEQRRGVRDLQQQLRILGVGEADEMLVGGLGPGQRPFNGGPAVGVEQQSRRPVTDDAAKRAASGSEDRLWQPEGGE